MREIKFRAWDSEKKRMLPIQRHSFKTGKSIPYGWNVEYVFDDLMQYTGLKDKNEKEIYDRDIVTYKGHKFKIVFEIGSFILVKLNEETDMYDLFKYCWNDNAYPLSQLFWNQENNYDLFLEDLEVIGNIYEDKHLLGEV